MKKITGKTNRIFGRAFSTRKGVIGLRKSFCGEKYLSFPYFTV